MSNVHASEPMLSKSATNPFETISIFVFRYHKSIVVLCALFLISNLLNFYLSTADFVVIKTLPKSALPPVTRQGQAFISITPLQPKVPRRSHAVCIGGHRDTLLKKSMSDNLIANVLIPNDADLFVYITVDNISSFPVETFQRLYEPWLKSFVIMEESVLAEEIQSFRIARPGAHVLTERAVQIFLKMHKCYETLLAPYEASRGIIPYKSVFYTRPDLYYIDKFHMDKYPDSRALYSPRPYNFNVYVSAHKDDPSNDGLLVWPGNNIGVNDQCFLSSSRVFGMVSHALWIIFSTNPERNPPSETFPEAELRWVLQDRLKIPVKAISDLATTICHDGQNCYAVQGKEVKIL